MRVGFHTAYRDDDLAHAALRLARFARELGYDVSIRSHHPGRCKVDRDWDSRVELEADRSFGEWVKSCRVVVWTEPGPAELIAAAARVGAKTVVLLPWDFLGTSFQAFYRSADVLVSPVKEGATVLKENWPDARVKFVPWDVGLPPTRKPAPKDPSRVRVLFPVHGWQSGRVCPDVLTVVYRLMSALDHVDVTFLYNHKAVGTDGLKAVRRLAAKFGDRFEPLSDKGMSRDRVLVEYAAADLTAWASEFEGLGRVGLESLAMGTPVVAYDVPPQSEFLKDRCNAVLVPCELKYTTTGVPIVNPNPAEFGKALEDVCSRPRELSDMRRSVRYGLADRLARFKAGWKDIFSLR